MQYPVPYNKSRMSSAASTLGCFNHDAKFGLHDRRTADFHPSIWKDYFLQCASESKVYILPLIHAFGIYSSGMQSTS